MVDASLMSACPVWVGEPLSLIVGLPVFVYADKDWKDIVPVVEHLEAEQKCVHRIDALQPMVDNLDRYAEASDGGACGTSGTNCNTGGTGGVWVHGRLRSSTRMRMLQDTKATICKNTDNANVTIWMEEHLTMRHIRLALEDNCTSCTRHPNLTLDGGAHSLTPALEPDFTTCCL